MKHAKVSGFFWAGGLLTALMAAPTLVQAQMRSPLTPKVPPAGELLAAADALGMVRGLRSDVFDAVNRVQFTVQGVEQVPVHGSWKEFKTTATMFISYHQAASRLIIDRVDAQGAKVHAIAVVAGPYAWNEESPGVGGTPAMENISNKSIKASQGLRALRPR